MITFRRLLLLIGALMCSVAVPSFAQSTGATDVELRPHLATDLDRWTPGLRYHLGRRWGAVTQTSTWFASAATSGRLLTRPALNTEPLTLDLSAGFTVNFVQLDDSDRLPLTLDPDTVASTELRDYGRLDAAITAGLESNQTFDDAQFVGGLEAGYVNITSVGLWGWVPSVVISANGVVPIEDEARHLRGGDSDPFVSLRGVATIAPRIGEFLPGRALKPLGLHVQADGHWELGTEAPWRNAGLHTAGLVAVSLLYAVNQRVPLLDQVYARFGYGRLPPNVVVEQTWAIGLVLHPGQSARR